MAVRIVCRDALQYHRTSHKHDFTRENMTEDAARYWMVLMRKTRKKPMHSLCCPLHSPMAMICRLTDICPCSLDG